MYLTEDSVRNLFSLSVSKAYGNSAPVNRSIKSPCMRLSVSRVEQEVADEVEDSDRSTLHRGCARPLIQMRPPNSEKNGLTSENSIEPPIVRLKKVEIGRTPHMDSSHERQEY